MQLNRGIELYRLGNKYWSYVKVKDKELSLFYFTFLFLLFILSWT